MRRFYIIGFLVLVLCDTFTQVAFKFSAISVPNTFDLSWVVGLLMQKWLYLAVIGYIGAFITYMTLLKHAPIGPAYAVSHLEVVTTAAAAMFFFHEHMTMLQYAGALFIVAAIIVLAMGVKEGQEN